MQKLLQNKKIRLILPWLILLVFFTSGAWADIIYEEEITGGSPGSPAQKRLVHLKGSLWKEETFIAQAGQVVILNLDKEWVWIGDKRTKTMTQGPWEEMSGRLLVDPPQAAREIKATGEKQELLGYPVEKYLIKEAGEGFTVNWEVYAATELLGTEEVKKFDALFWQKMGFKSEYQQSWRAKLKGFPLLIIKKEQEPGGKEKLTTIRVLSFQDVLLDRREFEAPLLFK